MATLRPLTTPSIKSAARAPLRTIARANNHERRTFFTNPLSGPQTLTASRTIHHPHRLVYDIISDVAAYSSYVPYCRSSRVTRTSAPAPSSGHTYPEEAELLVGFGSAASETFWSRVYCVPYELIETVAGPHTETSLRPDQIAHHSARPPASEDPTRDGRVLSHLLTRWSLRPYPYKPPPGAAGLGGQDAAEAARKSLEQTSDLPGQEKTEVNLVIEYQFSNPVLAALSQAAAPKVADKMIEAFEKRVRMVIEGPGHVEERR